MSIRVAAQLHPQQGTYEAIRMAVGQAEDLGYDTIYNWDHFFPLYGDRNGPHFECWSMLAAWAEQTTRVEIGPLVACNSYRNPDLVADMARTIDHISRGRFVLGLGGGWCQRDYDEYGYEFGTAASRLTALRSALPRIKSRLDVLNPAPVRPIPILIAGTGEQITLRAVAEHGNRWHAMFPDHAEELEPKVTALHKWCDEIGRDPTEIAWGLGVEPEDLDRFLDKEAPDLVAMGFTEFTLGFNGPNWDVAQGADWLAWRNETNG